MGSSGEMGVVRLSCVLFLQHVITNCSTHDADLYSEFFLFDKVLLRVECLNLIVLWAIIC